MTATVSKTVLGESWVGGSNPLFSAEQHKGYIMITADIDNICIVMTEPKVMVKGYVDFGNGAEVDAVFDFSKIKPEHHQMALQVIMAGGMKIGL